MVSQCNFTSVSMCNTMEVKDQAEQTIDITDSKH